MSDEMVLFLCILEYQGLHWTFSDGTSISIYNGKMVVHEV